MKLFDIIEMKWSTQIEISLQRYPLVQLEVEYETKVLQVIHYDLKIALQDGPIQHIKVALVCTFKSAIFSLQFKFIEIKIFHPKVEAICHLNLTFTFILHRLEVYDILLLLMDYHGVQETQLAERLSKFLNLPRVGHLFFDVYEIKIFDLSSAYEQLMGLFLYHFFNSPI